MKKIIFVIGLIFFSNTLFSQNITGTVTDENNRPLAGVLVRTADKKSGTYTDANGYFGLNINSDTVTLVFSFLGYQTLDSFLIVSKNQVNLQITLKSQAFTLEEIRAYGYFSREPGTTVIRGTVLELVPSMSGNPVETLIMTSMGVQATNELSTQYSVRGGSYDENLVFIDGIKIFRPILLRSGQQEGLSVINPDMVKNIRFSAGGFGAQYGDKMSSVLDISYRTPENKRFVAEAGLTGLSASADFVPSSGHWSLMTGLRIKQNSYLLNALPVKGNYKPFFSDFQALFRFNPSEKWRLKFFNYLSYNRYNFYPDSLTIAIGTFTTNFKIPVYYQGGENDLYASGLWAGELTYKPAYNFQISLISSYYAANEQERYTFDAIYRLDIVDREMTQTTRDSVINIGLGEFIDYGRNFLNVGVWRNVLKINWEQPDNSMIFGVEYQHNTISDRLSRWRYIDSAGYSFNPYASSPDVIDLYSYQSATNSFSDYRLDVYLSDFYRFYAGLTKIKLDLGLRYIYWSYAQSNDFDPRVSVYFYPDWVKKWSFRLSAGKYTQVPFYNDLRNLDGSLVSSDIAHTQKALHLVFGAYRDFMMWDRPFRFTTEWYYKYLYDIIPFEYDNLRIQYYADKVSKGFAYGADFRLYGEFVPETDSWISLSLLHTAEDVENDGYWQYIDAQGNYTSYKPLAVDSVFVEPGYIPRPTDQLVTIGMFFQDYMPQNRNMRVSLGLFYGSGRPYGPPGKGRQYATLRMPMYLRADIGFLYLWKPGFARSVIFEIDLLNAFNAQNVASYTWLTVLTNPALIGSPLGNAYMVQIAAPNYLTGRLVNFKIKVKF